MAENDNTRFTLKPVRYTEYDYYIGKMGGGAKNNHYSVDLDIPQAIIDKMNVLRRRGGLGEVTRNEMNELLEYACEVVSLNTIADIDTTDVITYAEKRNRATGVKYNSIVLTFLCDYEGKIYNFISAWKECMYSSETKLLGWYASYVAPTLKVRVTKKLNNSLSKTSKIGYRNAEEVITVVCKEVFPTTVDPLALNGGSGSENLRMAVTFVSRVIDVYPNDMSSSKAVPFVKIKQPEVKSPAPTVTPSAPVKEPEQTSNEIKQTIKVDGYDVPVQIKWEKPEGDDQGESTVWIAKISVDGGEYIVTDVSVDENNLGSGGFPKLEISNMGAETEEALKNAAYDIRKEEENKEVFPGQEQTSNC